MTLMIRMLKLALVVLLALCLLPWLIPMPERRALPLASPFDNGAMVEHCERRWHLQRWEPAVEPRAMVLLLHGFAGSTYSWRLTGPALAQAGYRAVAVDRAPYGYGERRPPDDPVSTCLAEIARDEAGELPVIAVGHSMGAALATRVAGALGTQAQGLVLVDGGFGGRSARNLSGRAPGLLLAFPPLARWAEVIGYWHLLRPERFAATLASAYGREVSVDEVEGYRAPLLIAGTAPAIFAASPAEPAVDPTRLSTPVLIVWGRRDNWVPPAVAERLQALLPEARMYWVEEAGHNPMETHPDDFMQALLDFLGEQGVAR